VQALNHYVGFYYPDPVFVDPNYAVHPDAIAAPEWILGPVVFLAVAAAGVFVALAPTDRKLRLGLLGQLAGATVAFVGTFAIVQYRLFQAGHALGESAPVVGVREFTPPLLGGYEIANISGVAWFGPGGYLAGIGFLLLVVAYLLRDSQVTVGEAPGRVRDRLSGEVTKTATATESPNRSVRPPRKLPRHRPPRTPNPSRPRTGRHRTTRERTDRPKTDPKRGKLMSRLPSIGGLGSARAVFVAAAVVLAVVLAGVVAATGAGSPGATRPAPETEANRSSSRRRTTRTDRRTRGPRRSCATGDDTDADPEIYDDLSAAVDAAGPGDTIELSGVFEPAETVIVDEPGMTIRAASTHDALIDGGGEDTTIAVRAPNATVEGSGSTTPEKTSNRRTPRCTSPRTPRERLSRTCTSPTPRSGSGSTAPTK